MSDDLIRRSDAIEAIRKARTNDVISYQYADLFINALCRVPYTDRLNGEWIVSCKDSVCSVYGKDEAEFICGTEDWYGYGLSNFCPNCGARMKGVENEVR